MGSMSIWHLIILLVVIVIYIPPLWRIASKAGYSGAWSILMLVPLLNLVLIWVFAFSSWPAARK